MTFPLGNAWSEQKADLLARIDKHRDELETADSWARATYVQGQIAALRAVIDDAEPATRAGVGHKTY